MDVTSNQLVLGIAQQWCACNDQTVFSGPWQVRDGTIACGTACWSCVDPCLVSCLMAASRTWQRPRQQRQNVPGPGLSTHATASHQLLCHHSVRCVCVGQEDMDSRGPLSVLTVAAAVAAAEADVAWGQPDAPPARLPAQRRITPAPSGDELALQQQVRMHAAWERSCDTPLVLPSLEYISVLLWHSSLLMPSTRCTLCTSMADDLTVVVAPR